MMIIKDLKIKNSSINLNNVNLDLTSNGFYLLNGENGTGKREHGNKRKDWEGKKKYI